ncbi:MAG: DNA-3-methyladenine glycosylase [Ignavibacteriales bacterium]|nr:DNA-3-methyladenine glycosylase [Ignavibacteriales bacterium]
MSSLNPVQKLTKKFYDQDVLTVARNLLGKILIRKDKVYNYSGKIVEVEAYDGFIDEASHSFKGKTKRNEIMFGNGGYLYVYFTYGMYFCCNVVSGKQGEGKAVLIRAVEPLEGIEKMAINRFGKNFLNEKEFLNLTSGPGKICKAFNISNKDNGIDLLGDEIYIQNAKKIREEKIVVTKRIGITKSTELLWRFYIKDNPFVSKK